MQLTVIYDKQRQVDMALDDKIRKSMESIGFKFHASGCNHINGKRDLVFKDKGV